MSGDTYTRAEHMAEYGVLSAEARFAAHRRYYAQLVNFATVQTVRYGIGEQRLLASTDPHLNDIPLHQWDRVAVVMPYSHRWKDLGDFPSPAGLVCIAKEAARQCIDTEPDER